MWHGGCMDGWRVIMKGRYEGEGCLSMGDFHPGSVLVSGFGETTKTELVVTLGVIDWEFATVRDGRG